MVKSMTGFAVAAGECVGWTWAWDMRAVNARGYDLRLRLPDSVPWLDKLARDTVGAVVKRGNVTLSLRLTRAGAEAGETLDMDALMRVLGHLAAIDAAAEEAGIGLARATAADILAMRGVLGTAAPEDNMKGLSDALKADLPGLVADFDAMRKEEGTALRGVLQTQLDRIATLTQESAALAEDRKDAQAARLRENLARVMDNTDGADPDRVAQELALIAVKTDVTEEIDRLTAHVAAARALLQAGEAVGRKFDFLAQEFNREANTLCSKAQSNDLTRVGLDLKAVIDQMREQVQNVE